MSRSTQNSPEQTRILISNSIITGCFTGTRMFSGSKKYPSTEQDILPLGINRTPKSTDQIPDREKMQKNKNQKH